MSPSTTSSPLAGRRVLVIGASSGIGAAAAAQLHALGAEVTGASRRATSAAGVRAVGLDVDDREAVEALAAELGSLDHVFVTAAEVVPGPISSLDPAVAAHVASSRTVGAITVARAFAPRLSAQGSLTFTSAIGAYRPQAGLVAATASAAGVEGVARALAVELAPLRVNAVRPGPTDTPLLRAFAPGDEEVAAYGAALPLGRVVSADEVAAAAVFLMANAAITGTVVTVDGGASLA